MVADIPPEFFQAERLRRRLHGDAARGADALRPLGRDPGRARLPRLRADLPRAPALRARRRLRGQGTTSPRPSRSSTAFLEARAARARRRPSSATTPAPTSSTWPRACCEGEILFRAGRSDEGIAALREARRARGRAALRRAAGLDPAGAPRARRRAAPGGPLRRGGGRLPRGPREAARQRLGALRPLARAAAAEEGGRGGARWRSTSTRSGSRPTSRSSRPASACRECELLDLLGLPLAAAHLANSVVPDIVLPSILPL